MSWKSELKKDADEDSVAGQSEAFHESLAEATEELIDDLQAAIVSGKVTDSKLTKIFKQHGIKFDVLKFNYGDINY
tara:strand:- start:601 stop:828 length:228 start_codon:yes stop_codon:yes gene_type:complete